MLVAYSDLRMDALLEVLRTKMVKRNVPIRNLKIGDPITGTMGSVRRTVGLTQGIPQETAKRIIKAIRDQGFKKVQGSIQGEEIRVTAPSKDELQEVIAFLRGQDFELELKFGNYRG